MNDFSLYFVTGWEHIVTTEALDHILFIVCLTAIYTLKDWKPVLVLITAFTIGHSITLALSTLQLVQVPVDWVEFLVPCTIVLTGISNLFVKTFTLKSIRVNYFLALFFGLIHGMAFAETLRFMLASDQSFALSMFAFSLGLELGQVLVVLLVLALAYFFLGILQVNRKEWVVFLSAIAIALAAQMVLDRRPWKGPQEIGHSSISNRHPSTTSYTFIHQNKKST